MKRATVDGTSLRDRVADADHITELHNLWRSCLATRTVIQVSYGILIALNGSRGLLSGSEPDMKAFSRRSTVQLLMCYFIYLSWYARSFVVLTRSSTT